ncbi:MAG: PilC/PilY family type IV pilus protein [Gammaproteobacteria bacterium]
MNAKFFCAVLILLMGAALSSPSRAQITYSEDFTGAATTNSWYYFNGACLTAGTAAVGANPGAIPGCGAVLSSYYALQTNHDSAMVGGNSGFLGSTSAPSIPDPAGSGALRFTNGAPYGHNESGAILSANTFNTGAGIQVTFKTITYKGDSGGAGGDGADGISFFLMDGSKPAGLGAFGGSLAYSCANNNVPHDGINGGYIGLGIDEYGNFLNGTYLASGYIGTNSATGDNSAYGYGYKPGRIGLRGAGSISFTGLTTAYGTDPGNAALPYYPASLATSCNISGGVYSMATNNCTQICSAGSTYYAAGNVCNQACTAGGVYDPGTNTCQSCTSVAGTLSGGQCTATNSCPAGTTYFNGTASCDSCPAAGYAGGNYANGLCANSCPTGYVQNGVTAYCYPSGNVGGVGAGAGFYCPAGSNTPTLYSGTYYCYPSGGAFSAGNYCPSGQSITGASCYPTGAVYSGTNYCPATNVISGTNCCPAGYTYSAGTGTCQMAGNPDIAPTAATAMTPATAATAAAGSTATQTVTADATPTQITTPVASAPATLAPATALVDAQYAIQNTCRTGNLYNYVSAAAPSNAGPATLANPANTKGILDYAPIPNAYKEVTSFQIAAEGANTRGAATPIFYNLKITQDGLLSLSYSTGGAYSSLISNQDIKSANGPLPATFRVGFAGSTGGSTNIHEIMCFRAASAVSSGSSATVNEKQTAKVQAGTQAYFAYYNPNDWTGTVTANDLIDTAGVISVAGIANWDASCLLSGTAAGAPATGGGCASTNTSGPTPATPVAAGRIMLTWDTVNSVGIPFEWASLNPAQQAALTAGDATINSDRLNYLRGNRSKEINSAGVGLFRARDAVLGDIVDSSPAWVGPPNSPYTATWQDRLSPATVMPENTVAQSYVQFTTAQQTRLNVVYVGANDGFVHGFRAGSFDVNGVFVANGATPNDGQEVMSYMPGSLLQSMAASGAPGGCTHNTDTGTVVQQIHGVTPAIGANAQCVEPTLDYSNSQYGHNFFVDATPGTGDLYYAGNWHTWLVGGLGGGGAAIYALDVTTPSYSEGSASSTVIGEWNAGSISCALVANCGNNLGNTYGTPQIRRLHNGDWAAILGSGIGSRTGDAGIYVMTIDSTSGATTFYYLSTGTAGTGNGISYVTPADLDGDHITDYVYAGDLNGHVWRFDLTASNPARWGVTNAGGISVNALSGGGGPAAALFATQSGQPISSQLLVVSSVVAGAPRLLVEFGTGQRTQLNNLTPVSFVSGTQSLYGVWDWNLTNWNTISPSFSYQSLTAVTVGISSPYLLTNANLTAQTLTANANGTVDGTNVAICWQGSSACGSGNTQFGWYADLPHGNEQIIFNPVFFQGAFLINSTVPANNALASCATDQDTGYTYALSVANGGAFTNTFPTYTRNGVLITDAIAAGIQTNATGSVYVVSTAEHTTNIVYQTISGTPGAQQINIPPNTKAKRLTWIERR